MGSFSKLYHTGICPEISVKDIQYIESLYCSYPCFQRMRQEAMDAMNIVDTEFWLERYFQLTTVGFPAIARYLTVCSLGMTLKCLQGACMSVVAREEQVE